MKSKPLSTMTCPKCNGHGTIPLSTEMQATLLTVEKIGKATVSAVKKAIDPLDYFHVTAFNNRLSALHDLGLLKREKKSREWVYFKP